MRTNIVIDDELMTEAMRLTGIGTKRAVVEKALRLLVDTSKQKKVLALRGKIDWQGDLDEMRDGRFVPQGPVQSHASADVRRGLLLHEEEVGYSAGSSADS